MLSNCQPDSRQSNYNKIERKPVQRDRDSAVTMRSRELLNWVKGPRWGPRLLGSAHNNDKAIKEAQKFPKANDDCDCSCSSPAAAAADVTVMTMMTMAKEK